MSTDTQPFPIESFAWMPEAMYSSIYERVCSILIKVISNKTYPLIHCFFKNKKNGTIIFEGEKLWPHHMENWEIGQLYGGN